MEFTLKIDGKLTQHGKPKIQSTQNYHTLQLNIYGLLTKIISTKSKKLSESCLMHLTENWFDQKRII